MLLQPRTFKTRQHNIIIYPRGNPTEPIIELVFAYDTTVVLLLSLRRLENVFTLFFFYYFSFIFHTERTHCILLYNYDNCVL